MKKNRTRPSVVSSGKVQIPRDRLVFAAANTREKLLAALEELDTENPKSLQRGRELTIELADILGQILHHMKFPMESQIANPKRLYAGNIEGRNLTDKEQLAMRKKARQYKAQGQTRKK